MFKKPNKILNSFKRSVSVILIFTFISTSIITPQTASAQSIINMPLPGVMVKPSVVFTPTLIKGVQVFADQPFKFDFIVDPGSDGYDEDKFREESAKLIKYFLASLTVPEKDLWVNLSPFEKDRIVPDEFGITEMGRDLLSQDYLLKQFTASLMHPGDELGKKFWKRIHRIASEKFGTSDVPVNTFNKVWIVPEKAEIYETENRAFVIDSKLKVMLEEDYEAMSNQGDIAESRAPARDLAMNIQKAVSQEQNSQTTEVATQIIREVLIPEIEREINEGEHFAQLRQIYHSLILATWYKETLKQSLINQIYSDQNKIEGIDVEDKEIKQKIYDQYIEAFKKGVFDFIKEEYDPQTQEIIPRKYFSGGLELNVKPTLTRTSDFQAAAENITDGAMVVSTRVERSEFKGREDLAMTAAEVAARRAKLKEIADSLREAKTIIEIHQILITKKGFERVTLHAVRDDYGRESSAFYHHRKVKKDTRVSDFASKRRAKLKEIADSLKEAKTIAEIHQILITNEGFEGVTEDTVRHDYRYESSEFYQHPKVKISTQDREFSSKRRAKLKEIADGLTEAKTITEIHQILITKKGFEKVTKQTVRHDYRYENSEFYQHPKVKMIKSRALSPVIIAYSMQCYPFEPFFSN